MPNDLGYCKVICIFKDNKYIMKFILFCFLFFFSTGIKCQNLIGETEAEVYKIMKKENHVFFKKELEKTGLGHLIMFKDTSNGVYISYFISKTKVCIAYVLNIDIEDLFKAMVSNFDKEYIKLNSKCWIQIIDGKVFAWDSGTATNGFYTLTATRIR